YLSPQFMVARARAGIAIPKALGEPGGSGQANRKLAEIPPGKRRTSAQKGQPKWRKRPPRYRYGAVHRDPSDCSWGIWGMCIEAMNWGGMVHAEYAAALGLSPHTLRVWRDRREQIRQRNELAIPASSECPGSIKQRC